MDFSFLDWKVGELSVFTSFVLLVFARWVWFFGKLTIYTLSIWLLKHRWMVRVCALLWIRTNWDLGEALLKIFKNSWVMSLQSSSNSGQSSVDMNIRTENKEGEDDTPHPIKSTVTIESEWRSEFSDRLDRLDRLSVYRREFREEVISILASFES